MGNAQGRVDRASTRPGDAKHSRAIAKDAYLYGFPMVMNYQTINQ